MRNITNLMDSKFTKVILYELFQPFQETTDYSIRKKIRRHLMEKRTVVQELSDMTITGLMGLPN